MSKPKITWLVQDEEDNFIASKSYTAEGSYTPGDYLIKNIQIWNNYNGSENLDSLENAQLVLAFKNYEDNFLLNLLEISTDDQEYKKLKIYIDRGYIDLKTLTGHSNVGQADSSNCANIKVKIGPIPENLRSELKSLVLYLNETDLYYQDNSNSNENDNNVIVKPEGNIVGTITDADKDYFLTSDKNTLKAAIDYVDKQIKALANKIIDSSPNSLNTLKELANALNNNPYYASDDSKAKEVLQKKISLLENITDGFNEPIKDYVDAINPGIDEDYTEQELNDIIEALKNMIN